MCEWTKPDSQFGTQRHRRQHEKPCSDCLAAAAAYCRNRTAALRAAGKDTMRWRTIWSQYRLRRHDHEAILSQQENLCAICRTSAAVYIDHDHACAHPGKGYQSCAECVRGILCNRCNLAIPILDDIEWLKKALDYLGREDTAEVIRRSRLW
jgi:Recombination endonuclease VII